LVNNAAAQLPALPDQSIEYHQMRWWFDVDGDIETEWTSYFAYPSPENDTLMALYHNGFIGHLYGNDAQIWYKGQGIGSSDTIWRLLYNFSLQVGDTAYIDDNDGSQGPGDPAIIDSITTTNLYSYPFSLKVFHLSNYDRIIECIGSEQGLFRPYTTSFEQSTRLCWSEGFFNDAEGSFAGFWTEEGFCGGSSGLNGKTIGLAVYPNPFSSSLNISSEKLVKEVLLFDGTGRELEHVFAGQDQLEIEMIGLLPGMYILKILFEDGTVLQESCVHR
jgi:hypothetical protein